MVSGVTCDFFLVLFCPPLCRLQARSHPPFLVSSHICIASQCVLFCKTHCDRGGRSGRRNGISFPKCPARDEQRPKKISPWQTVNSCLPGGDFFRLMSALASEHLEKRSRSVSRTFRLDPLSYIRTYQRQQLPGLLRKQLQ